jgi:hypothetical protein
MPLDRLAGEEEGIRDLRITVTGRDERRDLALPFAQPVQRGLTARRSTTPPRPDTESAQTQFCQLLLGGRPGGARFNAGLPELARPPAWRWS